MEENKEPELKRKEVLENNTQSTIAKKSNKKGLIIILVFIILLLAGGIIYVLYFSKPKESIKDDNSNIEQKENGNVITIYKGENGDLSISGDSDWYTPAFNIKVNDSEAKVLSLDYSNQFILYKDTDLYLYNVKTKGSNKVNLESDYEEYEIFLNEAYNNVIGIAYLKSNSKVGYYNVLEGKKLYDNKYSLYNSESGTTMSLSPSVYQINDSHIVIEEFGKAMYLLSSKEEKVELTTNLASEFYGYSSYSNNNKYIYTLGVCITETCYIYRIYNSDFKEIYRSRDEDPLLRASYDRVYFSFYNENIYFFEAGDDNHKTSIKKIDLNGKILLDIPIDYEILSIYDNKVIYSKDNTIYVKNIDNNEVKEIVKLSENDELYGFDDGFYFDVLLSEKEKKEKKIEKCLITKYKNKDSNGNYGMEYCYTKDKQILKYPVKKNLDGEGY